MSLKQSKLEHHYSLESELNVFYNAFHKPWNRTLM